MSSLRADFLAIRYAETCGKGASRKRMSYRGHPFKSGKGNFAEANALSVKDLEKLNDNELKLLPKKDFWDAKKKEWKKNAYGTFAKRNSVKMKKILTIADS